MGIDEAKKFAAELVEQAKKEIASFDSAKAVPLFHLADYIARRQS
jgi:geranylgeranyl diphosphate synthase type II